MYFLETAFEEVAMPTGQMSVRIDDGIRIAGNKAFESIGWAPSQAARAVWACAARNRRNPRKLREMRQLLVAAPAGSGMAKALMDFTETANMKSAYASASAKDAFYIICSEVKRLVREEKGGLSQADAREGSGRCVRCRRYARLPPYAG